MNDEPTGTCVLCAVSPDAPDDEHTQVPMEIELEGDVLEGDVRVCENHFDVIRRCLIVQSDDHEYPDDDPKTVLPDGGVTVFEDGTATTCPDCRGDLEYQNRVAVLCIGCGEQFDHFYSSVKHELCTTGDDGDLETVATAPVEDKELVTDGGQSSSDTEQRDSGVAAVGGLVCQNFAVHPGKEVKMVSGPYEGRQCPECGRFAGGGPPLDIPYVDEPGTPAAQSSTETDHSEGSSQ